MATQQTTCDESTAFETQIHVHVPDVNADSTIKSTSAKKLPSRKRSLMDYATPTASVSAFCRSVLSTLIPNEFWGDGNTQTHNKDVFMKSVDRFITLRRFETVSLHDVIQGMKVSKKNSVLWTCLKCIIHGDGLTSRRSTTLPGLVHKIMLAQGCRNQIGESVRISSMSLSTTFLIQYLFR
jgi:hypothetical protein